MAGNWSWSRKIPANEATRILRFGFIGGVTFVIYFGLQFLLDVVGAAPLLALTIAYGIAVTFHYTCNRIFTFRNVSRELKANSESLPRYVAVNIINYGVTVAVVQAGRSLGFDIRIGMVAAVLVTIVTGYLMYKFWVFR